jgi:uncharacterized protein YpmS
MYKIPDYEAFTGKDLEILMRSDIFREGGLLNYNYKQDGKASLDKQAMADICCVSTRSIFEYLKGARDIPEFVHRILEKEVLLANANIHIQELKNLKLDK